MKGRQNPESKVANWELLPKYPLQSASPALQLVIDAPWTGSVICRNPPVQPSQQPPSSTLKGVYWVAMLYQGRIMVLGRLRQSKGSDLLQGVSPSKGLQLLHEKRPAQLFQQEGQTVACMVRPFLMGRMLQTAVTEIAGCVCARTSSTSTASTPFITDFIITQKNTADARVLSKSFATWQPRKARLAAAAVLLSRSLSSSYSLQQ